MTMLTVRVRRKWLEATDIVAFELVSAEGEPLPRWTAGAHVDVELPGGLVRQYSLSGRPQEHDRYRIAVLREPASRGGSVAMHAVSEGALLRVSEPRNLFSLVPSRRVLLLAGGIGITPLLSMAWQLSADGADFAMHYCTRNVDRTAFLDEIHAAPFSGRVRFHHDDGAAQTRFDAAALLARPSVDTQIYVCGPSGFIEHVRAAAAGAGWGPAQVKREYFATAPIVRSADDAFQVRIASSGQTCNVAADETVVQALESIGIRVPVSCDMGVCGTCLTRVLEGECDHRDMFLTDEERERQDQFTPCCSRSRSAVLVLDL